MNFFDKEKNISNTDGIKVKEELEVENSKSFDNIKNTGKTLISCHNKFLINPSITKFNENSRFIYDLDEGKRYIDSINNANNVKLNEKEINILHTIYNTIMAEKKEKKENNEIIIEQNLLNDINNFFKKQETIDDNLTIFLKNEYNENKQRKGFTSRKLAQKYNLKSGTKINHVTINNTLKRNLGLKFLKVVPKSNKIISEDNALRIMTILKIISRCLIQKISIIYVDETSIMNINNNLRTWIKPGEDIFCEIEPRKRYNLIMAINEEGILHYEMHRCNIDEKIFIQFIENLKLEIVKKDIKYYTLFLDNLSVHKSKNAIKYFYENKINIIFNIPYLSRFNSIELGFRAVKNIIYKQVYENMENLKKDIYNILDSEKFQKTIRYNFKETIGEYKKYYEKYKNFDFNKFK